MKEDGWWLVLGNEATQELYAIKRTSFGERASARLSYTAASADEAANLQLQLVSEIDSFSGPQRVIVSSSRSCASTSTHSHACQKCSPVHLT